LGFILLSPARAKIFLLLFQRVVLMDGIAAVLAALQNPPLKYYFRLSLLPPNFLPFDDASFSSLPVWSLIEELASKAFQI